MARPPQFPCAQLGLLRLRTEPSRAEPSMPIGRQGRAGCWLLLTTAEAGRASHMRAAPHARGDGRMVSPKLFLATLLLFHSNRQQRQRTAADLESDLPSAGAQCTAAPRPQCRACACACWSPEASEDTSSASSPLSSLSPGGGKFSALR